MNELAKTNVQHVEVRRRLPRTAEECADVLFGRQTPAQEAMAQQRFMEELHRMSMRDAMRNCEKMGLPAYVYASRSFGPSRRSGFRVL